MDTELLDEVLLKQLEKSSVKSVTSSKLTKDGILKDVHLIGLHGKANKLPGSKTPYKFAEAAIKEAITEKRYDNIDVYIGHAEVDGQRNPKDKIGFVIPGTTKHREGSGGYGDIQYNTAHPYYEAMLFWIDQQPEGIMMSHVADMRVNKESNQVVNIARVYSVDMVLNGNTTMNMFGKEGVIADGIAADHVSSKLRDTVEKANSLMWRVMYPLNSYGSTDQNKVLTDPEKALLMAAIAKDLVAELKVLGASTKKESTMEYKDIALDALAKERPDLVKQIEAAAVDTANKFNAKVSECVKEIPEAKRSDAFMKQVRESLAKNDDAGAKAIVDDRLALVKESVAVVTSVESATFAAKETAGVKKQEKVAAKELTDDEVLAAIKSR